jgi:hypothetical protein
VRQLVTQKLLSALAAGIILAGAKWMSVPLVKAIAPSALAWGPSWTRTAEKSVLNAASILACTASGMARPPPVGIDTPSFGAASPALCRITGGSKTLNRDGICLPGSAACSACVSTSGSLRNCTGAESGAHTGCVSTSVRLPGDVGCWEAAPGST